jgi:serine/threonine-protein kinase
MPRLLKPAPGETLEGRFLLLQEIGRGGMSTVFKATDLENPGQPVAVKVRLPQFSSGVGSWSMFQHEAEIGLSLHHAAFLRFIPVTPNKGNLVVTEYVEGTTLASRIGHGRHLDEAEARSVASHLCDAVEYLHGQDFVHYDVKPANILLCNDGSLRLIDLGIAHRVVARRFPFMAPAPPLATTEYAAPEQIRRRRGQRSVDIYAIGCVLYEMLTGRPPYEGDDPFVVASARQIGDPKAPRALNPDISPETEEIVLRALRRDPAERYASAAALKVDIDRPSAVQVSGLAGRLVQVTWWRKVTRWGRYVAAVGIAPLAALVAAFRLLWWWLERKH